MEQQKIPDGYQQTEVGVIPKAWEVDVLANVCSKITDGTHDTPKPVVDGIPFLTAIHVKENRIDFDGCYYLNKEVHDEIYRRCNPQKYDVLMVNIGAGVATSALVTVKYEFSLKNVALLKPQAGKLIGSYLNYYQTYVKGNIVETVSAGGAQPFLSLTQIGQLKIALPNIKEQAAIANALSDVDALITSIETLIAKKQAIKTATMQQLLTGKKRLPPFDRYQSDDDTTASKNGARKGQLKGTQQTELGEIPEDWEVVNFGSVLTIKHGRDQKSVECEGGAYPILGTGGEMGRTNSYLYNKPSVLIGRKGTIDKPRFMDSPFWTVDTLFYSELKKHVDPKFVFYKFCLVDWRSYNEASGVPSLNSSTIENITQACPCEKDEQEAITSILSDVDSELYSLKQRLTKTQQIKQGMMQELLTGCTRLPFNKD